MQGIYFESPDRSTRQCKVFILNRPIVLLGNARYLVLDHPIVLLGNARYLVLGIYSHVAEKFKTPDKTADIFFYPHSTQILCLWFVYDI